MAVGILLVFVVLEIGTVIVACYYCWSEGGWEVVFINTLVTNTLTMSSNTSVDFECSNSYTSYQQQKYYGPIIGVLSTWVSFVRSTTVIVYKKRYVLHHI